MNIVLMPLICPRIGAFIQRPLRISVLVSWRKSFIHRHTNGTIHGHKEGYSQQMNATPKTKRAHIMSIAVSTCGLAETVA